MTQSSRVLSPGFRARIFDLALRPERHYPTRRVPLDAVRVSRVENQKVQVTSTTPIIVLPVGPAIQITTVKPT